MRIFLPIMKKEVKERQAQATGGTSNIGMKVQVVTTAPPSGESGARSEHGDDAITAKQRQSRNKAMSYGPNHDGHDAIQRRKAVRECCAGRDNGKMARLCCK